MKEVMIDGVAYVPKDTATVTIDFGTIRAFEFEPARQDIREYCKEHRCWAAKDGNGIWWEWTSKPEAINNPMSNTWNCGHGVVAGLPHNLTFPDVPWDKSLVAPDGSMPLWDEKGVKMPDGKAKPQVGKWYKSIFGGSKDQIGQLKSIDPEYEKDKCASHLMYFPNWNEGHDGGNRRYPGNHCYWCFGEYLEEVPEPKEKAYKIKPKTTEVGKWYEVIGHQSSDVIGLRGKCEKISGEWMILKSLGRMISLRDADLMEIPAPLAPKPKRGDPIFVWRSDHDSRCPAPVLYFHCINGNNKVVCFCSGKFGVSSSPYQSWDHYRAFDPTLVGVPRKDWPQV